MRNTNDYNERRPRRTARSRGSKERLNEIRNLSSRIDPDYTEDDYYDTDDSYINRRNDYNRQRDSLYAHRNTGANAGMGSSYNSAAVSENMSSLEREAERNERLYGINATEIRSGRTAQRNGRNAAGRSVPGSTVARHRRKNPFKRFLAALLVMVLICTGGFFAWSQIKNLMKPKYWTIAVFGVDSRDGNLGAGALSDVIMLASINRRTGDVNLTSVYRDTYLQIDDDGNYHKINEAYFKGGYEQAIDALNRNFQLDIDDYVTFNWKAVAEGITMLGGIDLDISDSEFAYINAFITETVNSTGLGSVQLEHSGMNHLDGVQAVAYGRLRLMDTDFNRTARQRKVLELALEKAKSANKKTLVATAMTVMSEIKTSIGADDILDLAQHAKDYNLAAAVGFPFSRDTTYVGKMSVVVPATLATNVIQLHPFLYGDDAAGFALNDTVKSISEHIQNKTGVGELSNADIPKIGGGTGVTRAADEAAETGSAQTETKKKSDEGSETVKESPEETKAKAETEAEKETEQKSAKETSEETIEDIETSEKASAEHDSQASESSKDEKETKDEKREETNEETRKESSKSEEPEETEFGPAGSEDGPSKSDSLGPAAGPGAGEVEVVPVGPS